MVRGVQESGQHTAAAAAAAAGSRGGRAGRACTGVAFVRGLTPPTLPAASQPNQVPLLLLPNTTSGPVHRARAGRPHPSRQHPHRNPPCGAQPPLCCAGRLRAVLRAARSALLPVAAAPPGLSSWLLLLRAAWRWRGSGRLTDGLLRACSAVTAARQACPSFGSRGAPGRGLGGCAHRQWGLEGCCCNGGARAGGGGGVCCSAALLLGVAALAGPAAAQSRHGVLIRV